MAEKEKRATAYGVLIQDVAGGEWDFVARNVEASNGRQAIAKVAERAGRYAAVPERSWTEEPVAFEPQPAKLVFGQSSLLEEPEPTQTPLASALEDVDAEVQAQTAAA